MLFNSYKKGFSASIELLCIALIKKHKFNFDLIRKELEKQIDCSKVDLYLFIRIIRLIESSDFLFEDIYNKYKDKVYLYDFNREPIELNIFNKPKEVDQKNQSKKDITSEFYEGFGNDI